MPGRGTPEDVAKALIKAKETIDKEPNFDDEDKNAVFCGVVDICKESVKTDYEIHWLNDHEY